MAHAEVEEELDVEVREEEPPFLAGQTKKTLDLSPVKIVKAPDGSLNRAALAGAQLAKERREIRQQEANEAADSQARDLTEGWLDPMAKEGDRSFAQDLRANQAPKPFEASTWRGSNGAKATSFGEITSLSIQDQRKSLPIYKLRDLLLDAIAKVSQIPLLYFYRIHRVTASNTHCHWRHWLWENNADGSVPCRSWLFRKRSNWLHTTTSCRRNVRSETCFRRGWMSIGSRSWIYYPFRGLHQSRNSHQIHD
jgi:hypothetical protein